MPRINDAIALKQRTYDRFDRAAKDAEFRDRTRHVGQPNRGQSRPAVIVRLRVIAGTVTAEGYPAYVQYTADGLTWDDYDTGYVRLSGTGLIVGQHYYGICVGLSAAGEVCYTLMSVAGDPITLDFVSNVCLQYDSGGALAGLTVEHRKAQVLGVLLTDETYCTTGDDGCCPTVTSPCCDDPLPRCYKVEFSNGTGYWACLDGYTIWLQYDEDFGTWATVNDGSVTVCDHDGDLQVTAGLLCVNDGLGTPYFRFIVRVQYQPGGTGPINECYMSGDGLEFYLNCEEMQEADGGVDYTWTGKTINCTESLDSIDGAGGTVDFSLSVADCDDVTDDTGGDTLPTECESCEPCPTEGGVWYVEGDTEPLICVDPVIFGIPQITCFFGQNGDTSGWFLYYDSGSGYWKLGNIDLGGDYELIAGSFDCDGPNTFTRSGYPDVTITRTP